MDRGTWWATVRDKDSDTTEQPTLLLVSFHMLIKIEKNKVEKN